MIQIETQAGAIATANNDNVCTGDAATCNFLLYIVNMMPYSSGDKHMAAASYFKKNPQLKVTVIKAEMMEDYDGDTIY